MNKYMKLADSTDGQNLIVLNTADSQIHYQAIRFGINVGSKICVTKNIKNGPVIITKNELEIAIGRKIAQNIEVKIIE